MLSSSGSSSVACPEAAIKLERSAEQCVNCLLELIKTRAFASKSEAAAPGAPLGADLSVPEVLLAGQLRGSGGHRGYPGHFQEVSGPVARRDRSLVSQFKVWNRSIRIRMCQMRMLFRGTPTDCAT